MLNDVGTLASIVGLPLTLFQWWQSRRDQRHSGKKDDGAEAVRDYLEWLRREDQGILLEQIESSRTAIFELERLLRELSHQTSADARSVLERMAEGERRLVGKIDLLSVKLDRMLFPPDSLPADPRVVEFEKRYLELIEKAYDRLRLLGVRAMRDVRQKTSIAFVSLNVRRGDDEDEPRPAEQVLKASRERVS